MVEIIRTEVLHELNLNAHDCLSTYCGLDVLNTLDLYHTIAPQLDAHTAKIYNFSKSLQGPVISMMLRGIKIDDAVRRRTLHELRVRKNRYETIINQFADAVWDRPLNVESPQQMKDFFYKAMQVPEQKSRKGNKYVVSADREALEKISAYFYCTPIVTVILALRDVLGEIEVCERSVHDDGRMRCSFNIAGTVSGRFSSSKDIEGKGSNLQNVKGPLRDMFIADEGQKLGYVDLEQAESRAVGLLSKIYCGDPTYLNSCLEGDLHTLVCKMVWPELPWTGDNGADKKVAETPYYGHYSFRDLSKRAGHLSNYGGSPNVMATALKIPRDVAADFQEKYFAAFPGIREWHRWVISELKAHGTLTTPFLRRRRFFGRPDDHKTINEAISYTPQSMIGDMLNSAMLAFWRKTYEGLPAELLIQVHDAIVIQFPEQYEDQVIQETINCLQTPLAGYEDFSIPSDAVTGWNWGKATKAYRPGIAYKKGEKVHFLNESKLFTFTRSVGADELVSPSSNALRKTNSNKNTDGCSSWKLGGDGRKRSPPLIWTTPSIKDIL